MSTRLVHFGKVGGSGRSALHASAGLALVAIALLVLPATSHAAAPAWKLTTTSQPTNFAPGATPTGGDSFHQFPQYSLFATNVGSQATTGPIILTDTLPAGLTPVDAEMRSSSNYPIFIYTPCGISGQTVTCNTSESVAPGQYLQVAIPVEVSSSLTGALGDAASISGGGAGGAATASTTTTISAARAHFEFLPGAAGLSAAAIGVDGAPATQAGSHPYDLTIDAGFPSETIETPGGSTLFGAGHLRDLRVELPHGMVANPNATPVKCTEAELESDLNPSAGGGCPVESQVGTVTVRTQVTEGVTPVPAALYNMVAPPGAPAEFAFDAIGIGIYIHLLGEVRPDGRYVLAASSRDILARQTNPILGVQAQLWGNPSDPGHDHTRGRCLELGANYCPESVAPATIPFLTMPSSCARQLSLGAVADSWEEPSTEITDAASLEDSLGSPVTAQGCGQLEFTPTVSSKPTTEHADSPTGLDFDLKVAQHESIAGLAEANLKDARVTLPGGISVNPSGANGLAACSEGQVGYQPATGTFSDAPAECPDAAKIGSLTVTTQLLDHALPGAIYVAQPYANPFNSLLAIYLAVYDEETGVVIKLAGKVEPDPVTGRLAATFTENPELPFEDFALSFFEGPRSVLRTPATCGAFQTATTLTPWSTPEGSDAHPSDFFQISSSPAGGCPTTPSQVPFTQSFEAGTLSPLAGAYSPFVLRLKREDGTQEISALNVNLPPGLVGRLAGIPYCSDAALAAAGSRSGREEEKSPSCPSASEVGTVSVGAGSGSQPYYVQGHAYLAGPYKGAPLSLAIITPAVAGPFDLGTVVVRTALTVNPETAQITVKSDPIPSILQGIPLGIRSIAVSISRDGFTLNPTSCEAMAVGGESISTQGQAAKLSNRFQVGGCSGLAFKPKLKLQVFGKTNRNAKPRLKAVLTTRPGEANIRRAQVNLPHSLFLEQNHIKTVCTRVQWAEGSGNGSACPKGSIYGKTKAWTPLLDHPLEGFVYLRSNGGERKLPDMVAALNGQVDIALWGKVDSGANQGLRSTFEVVPDAPVSRFVLELSGRKKGLLVNSENLCSKTGRSRRAIVRFTGQNGKVESFKPKVTPSCGKGRKKK